MSTKRFPELSERLKLILAERHITQRKMADRLRCSAPHINQMVRGKKKNIGDSLAQHISDVYGYRFEWVKYGNEPIHDESALRKVASELNEYEQYFEEKVDHLQHEVNSLRELLKRIGGNRG